MMSIIPSRTASLEVADDELGLDTHGPQDSLLEAGRWHLESEKRRLRERLGFSAHGEKPPPLDPRRRE